MSAEPRLPHQVPPDPERLSPLDRIFAPLAHLLASSTASGILVLAATAIALAIANSPLHAWWEHLLHQVTGIRLGDALWQTSIAHLINDGLMAVFFLLIGLEIKRELLVGELASPRRAALPVAAALGGMLAPAAIYALLNAGGPGAAGWGIPMATDIAFALGILRLSGRVPAAVLVLLAALAIVDDLGAILVIAVFYTDQLNLIALAAAGAIFAGLLCLGRLGLRHPLPFILGGLGLWAAVLASGIHATVAGVLLAIAIPIRGTVDPDRTIRWTADFAQAELTTPNTGDTIERLSDGIARGRSPLVAWEHALVPWVNLLIVPVFALANAGLVLDAGMLAAVASPVFWGIVAGLVLGKPLGVIGASLLARRLGLADLPAGLDRRGLLAVGLLAGVGFTMALFIGDLAFADPALLATAKAGVLAASLVAGVAGYALCRAAARSP